MGRDPKGVVSSTASGPVEIPPPAPEPPRRRQSDTRGNTLHTIERRMEEVGARLTELEGQVDCVTEWVADLRELAARLALLEARMDALVRAEGIHDRRCHELQGWMDGARQRDEWGPRRLWLWWWDAIRRWWAGG